MKITKAQQEQIKKVFLEQVLPVVIKLVQEYQAKQAKK